MYLAVSETAVSAALIREEGRRQLPVYYVSQAFQGAEFRYPRIEKIVFVLIVALTQTKTIFPSKSYPSNDRSTYQEIHEAT